MTFEEGVYFDHGVLSPGGRPESSLQAAVAPVRPPGPWLSGQPGANIPSFA